MHRRRFLSITAVGLAGVCGRPRMATASGLTLGDIKGSGKLRIGVEAAYVPFTFRKDGQIVGYDVDFAEIFCKSLGVKPDFIDTAVPQLESSWPGTEAIAFGHLGDGNVHFHVIAPQGSDEGEHGSEVSPQIPKARPVTGGSP